MRKPSSGPITVTIKEGSVTIVERTYQDADSAARSLEEAPRWLTDALYKVRRQARKRYARG